ncbi:MAG: hypothetical protein QNJ19_15700 [Woeseiaceae bacterium]|nr:hypothetical protein [Woeseiaceae bacterium]
MASTAIPLEIEKLATAVAVGSVFSLGSFLIIDSLEPAFLSQFEHYVSSQSFGVIAAIPVLAFLYVVGSILMIASDFFFQAFAKDNFQEEWDMLVEVCEMDNEFRTSLFATIYRKKKLLEGVAAPFVILGIGVVLESRNLPSLKVTMLLTGVAIVIIGIAMPFSTGRLHSDMRRLVAEDRHKPEDRSANGDHTQPRS